MYVSLLWMSDKLVDIKKEKRLNTGYIFPHYEIKMFLNDRTKCDTLLKVYCFKICKYV